MLTDAELVECFGAGELQEFSHRDHVRVVFARTRQTDKDEAIAFVRGGLRRLTERAGAPEKYHDTLTVAWARLVGELTARSPCLGFDEFMHAHPELARSSLMQDYYSPDVLFSAEARSRFVEPDLKDLT